MLQDDSWESDEVLRPLAGMERTVAVVGSGNFALNVRQQVWWGWRNYLRPRHRVFEVGLKIVPSQVGDPLTND